MNCLNKLSKFKTRAVNATAYDSGVYVVVSQDKKNKIKIAIYIDFINSLQVCLNKHCGYTHIGEGDLKAYPILHQYKKILYYQLAKYKSLRTLRNEIFHKVVKIVGETVWQVLMKPIKPQTTTFK